MNRTERLREYEDVEIRALFKQEAMHRELLKAAGGDPHWVRVEDGLPEDESCEYLLCITGRDGNTAYENATVTGYFEKGKFWPNGVGMTGVKVIAWMKMPVYEEDKVNARIEELFGSGGRAEGGRK